MIKNKQISKLIALPIYHDDCDEIISGQIRFLNNISDLKYM